MAMRKMILRTLILFMTLPFMYSVVAYPLLNRAVPLYGRILGSGPALAAEDTTPWTIKNSSQIGGWRNTMDMAGNHVYINEGPSLHAFR